MLYDQAQLAVAYLDAFQITREPEFEVARDILDYVPRDMTSKDGGFFSAEDADSPLAAEGAGKTEHAEGAFYVWTKKEIEDASAMPRRCFVSLRRPREWQRAERERSQGEFHGKNILIERQRGGDGDPKQSFTKTRRKFDNRWAEPAKVIVDPQNGRDRISTTKSSRPGTGSDDFGFARGAQVLHEPRISGSRDARRENLFARIFGMRNEALLRSVIARAVAGSKGFADDYAFIIQAMLVSLRSIVRCWSG